MNKVEKSKHDKHESAQRATKTRASERKEMKRKKYCRESKVYDIAVQCSGVQYRFSLKKVHNMDRK